MNLDNNCSFYSHESGSSGGVRIFQMLGGGGLGGRCQAGKGWDGDPNLLFDIIFAENCIKIKTGLRIATGKGI